MYHPNYFEPGKSKRKDCFDRLELIKKYIFGEEMLDVGCSEGFYSFGLREKFREILAIDNSEENIDKCMEIQRKYKVFNISFFPFDLVEGVDILQKLIYNCDTFLIIFLTSVDLLLQSSISKIYIGIFLYPI